MDGHRLRREFRRISYGEPSQATSPRDPWTASSRSSTEFNGAGASSSQSFAFHQSRAPQDQGTTRFVAARPRLHVRTDVPPVFPRTPETRRFQDNTAPVEFLPRTVFGSGNRASQSRQCSFRGQREPQTPGSAEPFPEYQEEVNSYSEKRLSDTPLNRAVQDLEEYLDYIAGPSVASFCYRKQNAAYPERSPNTQGQSTRTQFANYRNQHSQAFSPGPYSSGCWFGGREEQSPTGSASYSQSTSKGKRRVTWSDNCQDDTQFPDRTRTLQKTFYCEAELGSPQRPFPSTCFYPKKECELELDDRYFAGFSGIHTGESVSPSPVNSFQRSSSQFASGHKGRDLAWPVPPPSAPPSVTIRPYDSCPTPRPPSPAPSQHARRRHYSDPFAVGVKKFKKRPRDKPHKSSSGTLASAIKNFFHDSSKSSHRKSSGGDQVPPLNPADIPSNFRFAAVPRRKPSVRKKPIKDTRVYSSDLILLRQSGFPIEDFLDPDLSDSHSDNKPEPGSTVAVDTPTTEETPVPRNHPSYLRFVPSLGYREFTSVGPSDYFSRDAHSTTPQASLPVSSSSRDLFLSLSLSPSRDRNDTMSSHRVSESLDPTSAVAAITRQKAEAIKLAREQGAAVKEMCRRANTDVPSYVFEELIGKGAYGRVYKGRQASSGELVAIKVMDVDAMDYKAPRDFKDESIKDFIHETNVLTQVKQAGAKNVNQLVEALSVHSQLWLVCEYCPGGSVRTLMRATGDKLEERFIIPIARELAEGLRAIHAAGVIHRDVKAANILIHEEGRLQICDFGVAGVLQSQLDKRSTWIGTPHWMPPEMFSTRGQVHHYGSEIDVWAYGCTLFEFATGNPPNSGLRERMQIGRQLSRNTPKLDGEAYSEELKDLVSFALDSNPGARPTMADILTHPYIAGSEDQYPTSSLSELVRIYYQWSQGGGQRTSLFNPGGAVAAQLSDLDTSLDDWNFSTTDNFQRRYSVIDLDQLAASLAELEAELTPTQASPERAHFESDAETEMTPEDRANFEERVRRGAAALEGLFDLSKPPYKYETKRDFVPVEPKQSYSDLPLRNDTDRSSVMSTFIDIDIGAFDSSHYAAGSASAQPFQLADAHTIRATRSSGRLNRNSNEERSRSSSHSSLGQESDRDSQDLTLEPQTGPRPPTMEWSFPAFMQPPTEEETESKTEAERESVQESKDGAGIEQKTDKRATMEWTFPVMTEDAAGADSAGTSRFSTSTLRAPVLPLSQESTLRPRDSIGEPGDSRPSTSGSVVSETDFDPFRFDRPQTPPPPGSSFDHGNYNYPEILESAGDSDYERSSILDGPGPDEEEEGHDVIIHADAASSSSASQHPDLLFPTTIPARDQLDVIHHNPSRSPSRSPSAVSTDQLSSIGLGPLPTARRWSPSTTASTAASEENPGSPSSMAPIQFPDLVPPSLQSLTEGADDTNAMRRELDRLLGDFLDALSATGDALSRVKIEHEGNSNE